MFRLVFNFLVQSGILARVLLNTAKEDNGFQVDVLNTAKNNKGLDFPNLNPYLNHCCIKIIVTSVELAVGCVFEAPL